MRIFLLTVTLLVASVAAAPGTKTKRDILPGDSRYGTDYHLHHHHVHSSAGSAEASQYLPPAQPSNQYLQPEVKTAEAKQTYELPSTSYGVPFKTVQAPAAPAPQVQSVSKQYLGPVAAPVTSYGTPIVKEAEIVQQVQHIEQHEAHVEHHAAPVARVPHTSYGAPVQQQQQQVHHQVYQPAPVPHTSYGAPVQQQQQQQQVHHQVHQPAPVPHNSYGPPAQVHHQPAPQVQHVHQPAPVPHNSYGPPAQHVHQPAPQHVHQPAPAYGAPVQQHQQVQHVHQPAPAYGAPAQQHHQAHQQQQQASNGGYDYPVPAQRLVFEAPVQSIELSQSHSVENIPEQHDAVSVESARNSAQQQGYQYPQQQTDSKGGYVY